MQIQVDEAANGTNYPHIFLQETCHMDYKYLLIGLSLKMLENIIPTSSLQLNNVYVFLF